MSPSRLRRLIGGLLLLSLTACVTPPDGGPRAQLRLGDSLSISRTLAQTPLAEWPAGDWWRAFGDIQLDTLMTEALAGSPTLRVAAARIRLAEAGAARAGASLQPGFNLQADVTPQRFSENYLVPPPYAGAYYVPAQATANMNWELDFWGRNRAALDAALSRTGAARAEAQSARLTLAGAVVRAYVEFDRLTRQRQLAADEVERREAVRRLTGLREQARLASRDDLGLAHAGVAEAQAELANWDAALQLIRNRLAALAGQGPDRGLTLAAPHLGTSGKAALPSDLPAELLGRRPDLAAARLRVEAAKGEQRTARAAFYPNVNLTAFAGLQAIGLDKLLKAGSAVAGIGPAISLPIFDSVRLKAGLAASEADYDLAVEAYNGTLVEALREVADQLDGWRDANNRAIPLEAGLAEEEAHLRQVERREQADLASHLDVLDAHGRLLAVQRRLADNQARQLAAAAGLTEALGGGYRTVEPLKQGKTP